MILKEKLLALGIVVDNEYLDKYCKLISDNLTTKKEKFKTQQHHIIPRYFYKKIGIPVLKEDNLVNLSYSNHVLAHYYLMLCSSTDYFKIQNATMVYIALGRLTNIDDLEEVLDDLQLIYERYLINRPNLTEEAKRKIGEANKISLKGKKISKERVEKIRKRSSICKWYNNGIENKFIPKDQIPPKGFKPGMILTHTTKEDWMSKVHANRKPEDYNTTGGTIVINDGKNNKHIKKEELDNYLKEGWKKGKLPLGKLNWYNNGIKNTRAYECPEGYVLGRLITEETRKRLGDGMRGKHVSEETKRKISNKIKMVNDLERI